MFTIRQLFVSNQQSLEVKTRGKETRSSLVNMKAGIALVHTDPRSKFYLPAGLPSTTTDLMLSHYSFGPELRFKWLDKLDSFASFSTKPFSVHKCMHTPLLCVCSWVHRSVFVCMVHTYMKRYICTCVWTCWSPGITSSGIPCTP